MFKTPHLVVTVTEWWLLLSRGLIRSITEVTSWSSIFIKDKTRFQRSSPEQWCRRQQGPDDCQRRWELQSWVRGWPPGPLLCPPGCLQPAVWQEHYSKARRHVKAPVLVLFMNEFMYLVTHGCCSDCEDLIEPHHDRFTALHPKLFADVLGIVRVWFRFGCLVGKKC